MSQIVGIFILNKTKEYHIYFWNYLTIPNTSTKEKLPYKVKDSLTDSIILPELTHQLLIEKRKQFNPLRKISTTISIHKENYSILNLAHTPYTTWVKDDFQLDLENRSKVFSTTFKTSSYKIASFFKVDNSLKEDLWFNLEDYLITEFSKAFAKKESKAMIHGDGIATPNRKNGITN